MLPSPVGWPAPALVERMAAGENHVRTSDHGPCHRSGTRFLACYLHGARFRVPFPQPLSAASPSDLQASDR